MYPSHLGPGDRVDFVEPPEDGPILGYSHQAVATMHKNRQEDDRRLAERTNLYGYVVNNPVNLTDPSGLMFGWGYGNFCGWSRRATCPPGTGPKKPIDAIDAACEIHDCCQATWWTCNPYHIVKCSVQLCVSANAAQKSGCDASPDPKACRQAAIDVQKLYCLVGFVNPDEPISPDDPGYTPWPRGPKF